MRAVSIALSSIHGVCVIVGTEIVECTRPTHHSILSVLITKYFIIRSVAQNILAVNFDRFMKHSSTLGRSSCRPHATVDRKCRSFTQRNLLNIVCIHSITYYPNNFLGHWNSMQSKFSFMCISMNRSTPI